MKYTDIYQFVQALKDKLGWNIREHKILMFAVSYANNKANAPWDRYVLFSAMHHGSFIKMVSCFPPHFTLLACCSQEDEAAIIKWYRVRVKK